MKKVEIKGIIPPIVTPMNEDESVNEKELRNQVNRQIKGGIHGLFPFGTNGEGAEEVKLLIGIPHLIHKTIHNLGAAAGAGES